MPLIRLLAIDARLLSYYAIDATIQSPPLMLPLHHDAATLMPRQLSVLCLRFIAAIALSPPLPAAAAAAAGEPLSLIDGRAAIII
jgi:hypothetical protein